MAEEPPPHHPPRGYGVSVKKPFPSFSRQKEAKGSPTVTVGLDLSFSGEKELGSGLSPGTPQPRGEHVWREEYL